MTNMDGLLAGGASWLVVVLAILMVLLVLLIIIIGVIIVILVKKSKSKKAKKTVTPTPTGYVPDYEEGSEDTTVLNAKRVSAALKRMKTGAVTEITKSDFKIGKERKNVDFCITDNPAVSRVHATIVIREEMYYIVDMRSTNFTFVDDKKIQPGRETPLHNGAKITIADEDFIFQIR